MEGPLEVSEPGDTSARGSRVSRRSVLRFTALAVAAAPTLSQVAFAPAVQAQVAATGNIYGTVRDESGAVLPGVSVALTGAFGTRSTTTGSQGEFRFLNVDHGTHEVKASLTGFTTLTRPVTVSSGQNVELAVSLKVASVEETVTVSVEAPVVDTKRGEFDPSKFEDRYEDALKDLLKKS